tara:strand:+ start:2559 stop:2930 length:372 start_codon:yes stop_codon:yes gene_type:complete
MNSSTLNNLLRKDVVDIRFTRRRPRKGVAATRRMLCTLNEDILNSVNGRTVLNYLPPSNTLPYTIADKNISMAWDIMMQNFRMIGADNVNVLTVYPADDTFWDYFNNNIRVMNAEQKITYMNS